VPVPLGAIVTLLLEAVWIESAPIAVSFGVVTTDDPVIDVADTDVRLMAASKLTVG
tara:strand:- start:280 stop:447 length:168 start_codon:yes stop_codon:yes gene_type:complete